MSTGRNFAEGSPGELLFVNGQVPERNFFIIQTVIKEQRNFLIEFLSKIWFQLKGLNPIFVTTPKGRAHKKNTGNLLFDFQFRKTRQQHGSSERMPSQDNAVFAGGNFAADLFASPEVRRSIATE